MRILSAYCPQCDANVPVTVTPHGDTMVGAVILPAVLLRCIREGHTILRLGAVGGTDPVLDVQLGGAGIEPAVVPA